jgi:L-ascorbate metabolism protein UlaG (beta-lactamase superfamily)
MHVEWYGQSAFRLTAQDRTIVIDPFGDLSGLAGRGIQFDYPPIDGVAADLLLVTHEHADHNGVEAIGGDPAVLRSTAGRLQSPLGEVLAVASEHDAAAGTERGPNTIFVFDFDGVRVAHFGDFGQAALRDEQAAAIGARDAPAIVERLGARWVVPMHYRTPRIGFLETADDFLEAMPHVERLPGPIFDTAALPAHDGPLAVVPAAP